MMEMEVRQTDAARSRAILWALLFGNFVTGTGILLPAGMLSELASGVGVSLPAAGGLMLASGLVVALGAPLIAAFTSSVDRRSLLVLSMLIYLVTHIAAALSPSFEMLMASRIAMAVAAAIFTPQAAATVGALLPPEQRSSAITMIFIGWSMATVGGMPLGGYVANAFGWRAAFGIVAALSAAACVAVWMTVPAGVRIAKLSAASWKHVLSSKALMTVLLVTILNGTGQFTFFTYLNPSLKASLGASAALLTFVLVWYGVSATMGNVIASSVISRIGPARSALWTLLAMATGLAIWGTGANALWVVLIAASLWGLGTFATNSIQQARLAGLAPELTSASIALNTSAIYFGQAAGSGLGGALIKAGAMPYLPWVGAAILLSAAAVSTVAERYES
jgi:MFS transporter, DHA1 family, inner membrane transport protein